MPSFKFHYFDVLGRGEVIRLIFARANQKFENILYTFKDWEVIKAAEKAGEKELTIFGQLPVLEIEEDDGSKLKLAQYLVISEYLAKRFGLAGKNEKENLECQMFLHHGEDYFKSGCLIPFTSDSGKKKQMLEAFLKSGNQTCLNYYEKKLKANNTGFLVGNSLTAADLMFYQTVQHHKSELDQDVTAAHPLCTTLYNKVKNDPAVEKWQKENPVKGPTKLLGELVAPK